MANQQPFLSIVIPSYNEMNNLQRGVLNDVYAFLKKQTYSWELLLSDDGSTDGTLEHLQTFAKSKSGVIVLANAHAGKGPTVQAGMLAAQGQWRLFTDFDQSTPLAEVDKLLAWGKKGYAVVVGSREGQGSHREDEPWYRHIMGRGFNLLVQILAVKGINDTQCGFKLFADTAATPIFEHLFVYGRRKTRQDAFTGAFDVEALYLAQKWSLKIKEVPIQWQHYETNRVSPVKDSIRMLIDIIKVRVAEAGGKYPRQLEK
jgi:dolichyl-phosphate beta-glucosyltransferase